VTSINIELDGMNKLLSQLAALGAAGDEVVQSAIEEIANDTMDLAKAGLAGGPKTGIVYEKYKPRRTHQASAPGQYPANDTGDFSNFIKTAYGDGFAEVGTNDRRGPWFEFGTSKMRARPWLLPSFERAKIGIESELRAKLEAMIK